MCYTSDMTCERCGAVLAVGDWPFCRGSASDHAPAAKFGFDPFTPYVDPHLLPHGDPRAHDSEFNSRLGRKVTGIRIESREQRKALMREQNLDWAPRPFGQGGSEV